MRTSKYLLVITMVIISSLARAEWQEVATTNDQSHFFVDWSTLKVNGSVRRAWTLRSFVNISPKSQPSSITSVTEFECVNDKIREMQVTGYEKQMAKGKSGELSSDSVGKWYFPEPQAPMFQVLKAVCNKR